MMKSKKLYTAEFKLRMVKEVTEKHKRPSAVAREHKVLASTLFSWRMLYARYGEQAFSHQVQGIPTLDVALHKELEQLRTREITFERLLGKLTLENHQLREQINVFGQ
ncbi:MAG: Transposase [Deinococcota bacterium]|jgi:transposase-like protein